MKTVFEMTVDGLRRTGKTQRMLDILEKDVNNGHYCFVICADSDHRRDLQRRFRDQIGGTIAGHKVYPKKPAGQATFEVPPVGDIKFDYERGRAYGAFPGCKYFMDHFAFEEIMRFFRWAVEQWEKWSLPEEQPKKSPMVGVDLGFKSLCPFVIDHARQDLFSRSAKKREDLDLYCRQCKAEFPHRYFPSPDAGPYWRCGVCGSANYDKEGRLPREENGGKIKLISAEREKTSLDKITVVSIDENEEK